MGILLNLFSGGREHEAYSILRSELPANLHLFTKVRLADIIDIEDRRLDQRDKDFALKASLDFLVTDQNYSPVHAVELHGIHHRFEPQKTRDERKRRICRIAGLKLTEIWALSPTMRAELLGRVIPARQLVSRGSEPEVAYPEQRTCHGCGWTAEEPWTSLPYCVICGRDWLENWLEDPLA